MLDNEDLKKFTEDLKTLKNANLQVFDRVNLPSQFFSSNHEQQVGKAIIKALEQRSKTNEALNEANEEVTLVQNTLNELNSKFLNKLDDANLEEANKANEANKHLKSVKNELINEDTEINNANEKIKEALKSDKIDNVIKNAREAEEKASSALININREINKVRKEKKNILQIISNVKSREIITELRENITNFENKTSELFNPPQPPPQTKLPTTTPQVENLPTMYELLKSLQNKVSEKKSFLNVLGNKFSIFLRRQ